MGPPRHVLVVGSIVVVCPSLAYSRVVEQVHVALGDEKGGTELNVAWSTEAQVWGAQARAFILWSEHPHDIEKLRVPKAELLHDGSSADQEMVWDLDAGDLCEQASEVADADFLAAVLFENVEGAQEVDAGTSFLFVAEATVDGGEKADYAKCEISSEWTKDESCVGVKSYMHRATLRHLNPGNRYYYRAGVLVHAPEHAHDEAKPTHTSWADLMCKTRARVAVSKTFSVRAPPRGKSVSFGVLGDLGLEGVLWEEPKKVEKTVFRKQWDPATQGPPQTSSTVFLDLLQDAVGDEIDVVVHLGDMAYELYGDNGRQGDRFMNKLEPLAAQIPYMVSLGNHEASMHTNAYTARFQNMPFSEENRGLDFLGGLSMWQMNVTVRNNHWYSFEAGFSTWVMISAEMFVLDDGAAYRGAQNEIAIQRQMKWLRRELENVNRTRTPWLFVGVHRPLYCTNTDAECSSQAKLIREGGKHGLGLEDINSMGQGLEELFYEFGVDICFAGHVHNYERFFDMRPTRTKTSSRYSAASGRRTVNPAATTYIVTGGGGNADGAVRFEEAMNPSFTAARVGGVFSYGKLTVANATHALYRHYAAENSAARGTIVDEVWMTQEHHGDFREHPNRDVAAPPLSVTEQWNFAISRFLYYERYIAAISQVVLFLLVLVYSCRWRQQLWEKCRIGGARAYAPLSMSAPRLHVGKTRLYVGPAI